MPFLTTATTLQVPRPSPFFFVVLQQYNTRNWKVHHQTYPHLFADVLTVTEQFGKVLGAQNITKGSLRHTVGRVESILYLDNRVNRIFDTKVDHCVHTSCNTVFGENLEGRREGGRGRRGRERKERGRREGSREGGRGLINMNNLAFLIRSHLLWGNIKGDRSKVNHSHIIHTG